MLPIGSLPTAGGLFSAAGILRIAAEKAVQGFWFSKSRDEARSAYLADLFKRFGASVHRRAMALLRNPADAMDVTQEIFLDFINKRTVLRGRASEFTVLYQTRVSPFWLRSRALIQRSTS